MEVEVIGREGQSLSDGRGTGLWVGYSVITNAGGTRALDDNTPHVTIVTIRLPRIWDSKGIE